MKQMQLARGKDVTFQFENGLAQTEILAGCSEDLRIFRCVLKKRPCLEAGIIQYHGQDSVFCIYFSKRVCTDYGPLLQYR